MTLSLNLSLAAPRASYGPGISGTPTAATIGTAYTWVPSTSGLTAPLTFALLAGTAPTGTTFSTTTGGFPGTPTTAQTRSGITIQVTDSFGTPHVLSLSGLSIVVSPALVLTNSPTLTGTAGSAYSFTPTTTGGRGSITWAITNLPSWGSFSTSTGALTGTPAGAETDAGIIIVGTDADGRTVTTGSFTITVSAGGGAVTGDPIAALVRDNTAIAGIDTWLFGSGCILDVTFKGNLGTVSTPDATKITVTTSYFGYVSGVLTALTRTIKGQKWLRQTAPNNTTAVVSVATDTTVSYVLANQIFSGETITNIAFVAGAYNTSNGLTLSTGLTNNSNVVPPKAVAKFVTPQDMEAPSGATVQRVEIAGTHWAARNNQQFESVAFTASDQSGHTVTQLVTAPSLSTTITGANANGVFAETWAWDVPLSSLTQGDVVTVNFKANPWVGTAATVLNSDVAGNGGDGIAYLSAGCSQLCPLRFLNNKTGAYGTAFAYVNSSTGVAGGVVSATAATARATPFDTIQHAAAAIQTFNGANFGHTDTGNGRIRLMDAAPHVQLGASMSALVPGKSWLVIEDDPLNAGQAIFTSAAASASTTTAKNPGDLTMWRGRITIQPNSTAAGENTLLFSGSTAGTGRRLFIGDGITFSNFTSVNTSVLRGFQWQFGRNFTCANMGSPFLASSSTNVENWMLQAGIVCTAAAGNLRLANTIGCYLVGTGSLVQVASAQTTEDSDGFLLMATKILNVKTSLTCANLGTGAMTRGAAIDSIIIENTDPTGSTPCFAPAGDGSDMNVQNLMITNSIFTGNRLNWYYTDDDTTVGLTKIGASGFCVIEQENRKSDQFIRTTPAATIGTAPQRTGGWRGRYNVDNAPNLLLGQDYSGSGSYPAFGLGEIAATGTVFTQTASNSEATMVTQRAAIFTAPASGQVGAGLGDYTWKAGLPAGYKMVAVGAGRNKYDLAGNLRNSATVGYPGPYEGP